MDHPSIYRIPVELPQNPLRTLNSYVIKTPEQSLIIDTGFNRPECRASLWTGIQELGLNLKKVSLFLTHPHSDHTGLVYDFVKHGIPVYTGKIDHDYFASTILGDTWSILEGLYCREGYPAEEIVLQASGNHARLYAPKGVYPATLLEDGETLQVGAVTVQVIHTPGHTPGHMVLYLPEEQILFSGDHILFNITPNIGIYTGVSDSLSNYLGSLEKIRSLPIRQTFPAHRGQKGDVYQRIDALKEHHRCRLEEIFRMVQSMPGATAYELAGRITWSVRGLKWEQFPPNQKWFAVSETLAHLYYMQHQGRVVRREVGDQFVYDPA